MNKNVFKSMFIMGVSSVIGYLVTLFLTSYITENIGIEAYGFVSIAKTFVNYSGIITTALTSFVVRYITLHYHRKELYEAKSYYVSAINASVVLCFFLTIIFSIIVLKLEIVIKIPQSLVIPVKLLFVWVFASFIATTLSTPFSIGFYIKSRLDLSGILKILSYISEVVVLVLLFSLFSSSVCFVGIGSFFASLTVLVGSIIANKKLVPNFYYKKELYSNGKVKTLIKNGLWNSINQLGNTLNSGLDLLVSNSMLAGIQTGQIAVAKSIGAIFSTLAGILFQPLQPELLKAYSEGVGEQLLSQLKKSMKVCGLFGSIAFSGFFSLGMLFYKLWLPKQNTSLLYLLTLLTVFTFIMDIFLQPIYYVNTLTVKNKIPCFVTIAGGLLNVAGMYILIQYSNVGIYSVPLTTAVIMFCINFFFNPVYACWCLKINKFYFYPLIIKHLLATVLMCAGFKIVALLIGSTGWIGLMMTALILVCLGFMFYFVIVFDKEDKTKIIRKIKNGFHF